MRNDADFAAYLAARWPFLVRSLVLIGCPQAEAEDVVQAGLARCHDSWDKVREDDDIDVFVYRTVLDGCHKQRRGWSGPPEVGTDRGADRRGAAPPGDRGRAAPADTGGP